MVGKQEIGSKRFATANPSFHLRQGYDVTSRRIAFRNSCLKRATIPGLAIAIAFLFPAQELRAGPASFEGTVSVSLTRSGTNTTQFLFTRKGNQLRIEDADKSKPEPINVVDLAANKLTIIYPHNSTFAQVDLTKAETQTSAGKRFHRDANSAN